MPVREFIIATEEKHLLVRQIHQIPYAIRNEIETVSVI